MTSEHYTYRRAGASPWVEAQKALDQFNELYLEAQKRFKGTGHDDPDADEALLKKFAFVPSPAAPSFPGSAFMTWMSYAFFIGDVPDPESVRPKGRMIMEIIDGRRDIQDFLTALDDYSDALRAVVRDIAPEKFSYQGFKVRNEDRLGDKMCRRLLEGADYITALFKKRGVEPLLHTGVSEVILASPPTLQRYGGKETNLGLYLSTSRSIVLSTELVGRGTGRFMEWINEAFLHEFGHFVHMSYLPPPAVEAWDAPWGGVKERQEALAKAFKSISAGERAKFFDVLHFAKFDASRAAKKLDPVSRVKFGVWLRNPIMGDPLITDKQFRLTKAGQYVALFYTDRKRFMQENYDWMPEGSEEYDRQVGNVHKRLQDKLGLLWDGALSIPVAAVEELSKADPSMQKAVEEALDKLEIVSPYGRTNEKEDFAETFVAFVGAPEKLTPTAKFRMQRTLSLANFYNKPVMRLSAAEKDSLTQHLVSRFLHAHRQ
jgi:hypothetical protein